MTRRPPLLTVLGSLDPLVRESVLTRAATVRPDTAIVQHELATIALDNTVRRTVRHRGTSEETVLDVDERCCLSCLLRDDTIATLDAIDAPDVLLALPPSVEPVAVALGLLDAGVATIDALVVAVDGSTLEQQLTATTPLREVSCLDDDRRTVAEVLGRLLEHSDLVLHTAADPRQTALLHATAPTAELLPSTVAPHHWLGSRRHDPERLITDLQPGVPRTVGRSAPALGVHRAVWHHRRPLHPQRFLDAVEQNGALEDVARASGSIWVATRPDIAFELEAVAGSCELGAVATWLEAGASWERAAPGRCRAAEERWDPYFGDRAQDVALVCLDRDPMDVIAVLDACVLTDEELADGEQAWRHWPDPFQAYFGDSSDRTGPPTER